MPNNGNEFDAVRIFFAGVGGQGTLLATHLVGEAAMEAGLPVMLSEIHGMAQRGGVVESTVVAGNVHSPIIDDGEADVLMAFEPVEAWRALPKCHRKTVMLANTVPIIPFMVATGRGTYPETERILGELSARLERFIHLDAVALARQAGNSRATNVVMVGVLAGLDVLPIPAEVWDRALEKTIPPKLLDINREAFRLGKEAARERAA